MTSNNAMIPSKMIKKAILLVRGEKVLLDRDLARLYGVSTSVLNKAVTRNIDRFPPDFMFQLSKDEFLGLKFHFGTSSWGEGLANCQGRLLSKALPCYQVYLEVSVLFRLT